MTMTQLGAVADSATLQAGAWRFPKRNSPADWMIAAGFDLLLIGAKRYLAHNHVLQGREVADILRHGVPFDWAAALQQNRTVLEASGIAIEARSEEHTSELQSLMRISYAVFCLKQKRQNKNKSTTYNEQSTITHTQRVRLYRTD